MKKAHFESTAPVALDHKKKFPLTTEAPKVREAAPLVPPPAPLAAAAPEPPAPVRAQGKKPASSAVAVVLLFLCLALGGSAWAQFTTNPPGVITLPDTQYDTNPPSNSGSGFAPIGQTQVTVDLNGRIIWPANFWQTNIAAAQASGFLGAGGITNVWLALANTNVLILSGFGPGFQTMTNDGFGDYIAGSTIDASAANSTYYWQPASQSYTNPANGFGIYNDVNTSQTWLTNAAHPLVIDPDNFVGSGVAAEGFSGTWFEGDGSTLYSGAVYFYQANLVPILSNNALASWVALPRLGLSNALNGKFSGDLSSSSNLFGTTSLNVSNVLTAGIISTTSLAHVVGIPPFEPLLASWATNPVLGYANWYDFTDCATIRRSNNAVNITASAQFYVNSGMLAAGYDWIIIDDGWQDPNRSNGHIQEYAPSFPSGIASLVSTLHGMGFKVMIYTSYPYGTCCGYPGTGPATIQADVTYFAQCGFDGIKIDSCGNNGPDYYESLEVGTRMFASAIERCGRPMQLWMNYPNFPPYPSFLRYQDNAFSIWVNGDQEAPSGTGVVYNADVTLTYHTNFIAPGHYTFSGALQRGVQNLKDTTNYVALLSMLQSYQNVCTPTVSQLPILTNREIVAIAKDPAVIPPYRVWDNGTLAVWAKPLGSWTSGTNAIALINRGGSPASIGLAWNSIGANWAMNVRDLWAQSTLGAFSGSFTNASVNAGDVRIYKVWPADIRMAYSGTNTVGTNTFVIRNGQIIIVQ